MPPLVGWSTDFLQQFVLVVPSRAMDKQRFHDDSIEFWRHIRELRAAIAIHQCVKYLVRRPRGKRSRRT